MENKSVQYGLVAGLIGIIVSLITFLFFSDQLGSGGFGIPTILNILFFIIWVYFMYKGAENKKQVQGGYIKFKKALKESFIVGAISSIIMFVYSLLAQFVLFTDVYDRIQERGMEKMIDQMQGQGQSEEAIDSAVQFTEKMQDMGIWLALPIFLIIAFIIDLIIAAIIKKKRPEAQVA